MSLSLLTQQQRDIIHECLKACSQGPFFEDWEFHTLFGITRKDLEKLIEEWPQVDDSNERVRLAINNALVNLLGYPHHRENKWAMYISVPQEEVASIMKLWREGKGSSTYFESLE